MRGIGTLRTASTLIAALALALPLPAQAQTAKAGVVTTLQGTATVARSTAPEPVSLRFKDDVFVQDRISTGDQSRARLLLGGKAVVTIRERSVLTISETPTTSTIEVTSGQIALAVNKQRMRPGDTVEIRTPNALAAVRGTVIIAEVAPGTAGAGGASRFTLLTGVVDVSLLDPSTGRPSGSPITLNPLQTIDVTGFTPPRGGPRTITRAEGQAIASQYKVTLPIAPASANQQVIDHQVQEAAGRTSPLAERAESGNDGQLERTSDGATSSGDNVGAGSGALGAAAGVGGFGGLSGPSGGGFTAGRGLGGLGGGLGSGGLVGGGVLGGGTSGGVLGGGTGGGVVGGIGGGIIRGR